MKEKRAQIANELHNLDKSRSSGHSNDSIYNFEQGEGSDHQHFHQHSVPNAENSQGSEGQSSERPPVIIKTFNLSKMLIEQETLKSILIWTEENQKASRRWTKGVLPCVLQEHTPDDACMPYWKFQNLFYIMHHGLIECQKIIYMGDFQFEILKASMLHQLLCTILVVEDKQFGMLIDREFLL